jgi:hypothetical protein
MPNLRVRMATKSIQISEYEKEEANAITESGEFMKTRIVGSAYATGAVVAILIGGCVATPQAAQVSKAVQKATFSGTVLNVWYFYAVQMDCTSAGLPTVWVTSAASHGSVQIQNVEHFTEYPATNQRFECNKKKSPSVAIVYTSGKSFVGVDRFTVKCAFPAGEVQTKEFLIIVEQPPAAQPAKG